MSSSVHIHAYNGDYHEGTLRVRGRLLSNSPISDSPADSIWRNFKNTLNRFMTNELENHPVYLWLDKRYEARSDEEGYFSFEIAGVPQYVIDKVVVTARPDKKDASATEVNVLTLDNELVIVSDIDDTIIKTQVSSVLKLRLLYNTIFKNPYQRIAVHGMPEIYRAIRARVGAHFYYISKSPNNLYPYLIRFLKHNRFPTGVLILRDFGWHLLSAKSSISEKQAELQALLERLPKKKFILVGDAAEKDADIYHYLAKLHPEQCKAICIRAIGHPDNLMRIKQDIQQVSNIPFFIFDNADQLKEQLDKIL